MRYIVIALLFLSSCKKEKTSTPNATTHTIKYEVNGTCCQINLDYIIGTDLKQYQSTNDFTWDYTFKAETGTTLKLLAMSEGGKEWTNIKIFQNGQLIGEKQGYNQQVISTSVQ